jgi:hypothetical protein
LIKSPPGPHPEHTGCFAFAATVGITPSPPNATSLTDAPESSSIRLNAAVTRTSHSFVDR